MTNRLGGWGTVRRDFYKRENRKVFFGFWILDSDFIVKQICQNDTLSQSMKQRCFVIKIGASTTKDATTSSWAF